MDLDYAVNCYTVLLQFLTTYGLMHTCSITCLLQIWGSFLIRTTVILLAISCKRWVLGLTNLWLYPKLRNPECFARLCSAFWLAVLRHLFALNVWSRTDFVFSQPAVSSVLGSTSGISLNDPCKWQCFIVAAADKRGEERISFVCYISYALFLIYVIFFHIFICFHLIHVVVKYELTVI